MKYFYFIALLSAISLNAQVGIGTDTVEDSAILQIDATDSGILVPRVTQTQKNAIASPVEGLIVYQTTNTEGFWYYTGSQWVTFGGSPWSLTGNMGTNPASNFVGSTDANDVIIATNDSERIRLQTDGDVGINEANP